MKKHNAAHRKKISLYAVLHGLFLLYSLVAVCSKMISQTPPFSPLFFVYGGAVFFLLGSYALLWQQLLKRLPLSVAFANKGAVVIWGMIWGVLLFRERITLPMLLGSALICAGIVMVNADG